MKQRSSITRRLPSPAMVVSLLALFVALGGAAYAGVTRNSVGTPELKRFAVKPTKLAPKAVRTAHLAPGTVRGNRLARQAVRTGHLAEGAVTESRLADGLAPTNLWAYYHGLGGGLQRSSGVVDTSREGPGSYEIEFNRDVSNCIYQATPRFEQSFVNVRHPLDAPIPTADPNVLQVRTSYYSEIAEGVVPDDAPFYLSVFC